jgi:TPR repeat protein
MAPSRSCIEAQVMLSTLYIQGLAVDVSGESERFFADPPASAEPDFESAVKWARMAAQTGSAEGQTLLGYILTCGPDSMRNLNEAHHWYRRSAMARCPQGHLGYALSLMRQSTDQKVMKVIAENLRPAAAAGLASAIYLLAVLTEHGQGVERDQTRAAQLFQDAAEKGQVEAQVQWGLKLLAGRDVVQDRAAGQWWLRRAAHAGNAQAAKLVGDIYVRNSGPLPPNYSEAAAWYRRRRGRRCCRRACDWFTLPHGRRCCPGRERGGAMVAHFS